MDVIRLYHTLKYVSPRMIRARLAYKMRTFLYLSPIYSFLQNVPETPKKLLINPPHLWVGDKTAAAHMIDGVFTFQNQSYLIGENLSDPLLISSIDWLPENATALWQFTLHYFEWLDDLAEHKSGTAHQTAQNLIASWLMHHDHFHPVIWHPYPLSLRLVSWLTHADWIMKNADAPFKEAFLDSLARQAEHLSRNTETWLGGNHYLKNLKALIYAGVCIPGYHAFFFNNVEKFIQELQKQVLPDGMHNERSPSYHVQVLKDALDVNALITKAGHTSPPQLSDIIERMTSALACLMNPDSTLPLFNDGTIDSASHIKSILKRCGGTGTIPTALMDAGYARFNSSKAARKKKALSLFFDAGAIGPDENPGHAHADSLAFELFLDDEKIFTNQGTYLYQCQSRNHYRSTEAHNTVDINATNSADVWASFRVGRRPTQTSLTITGHRDGAHTAIGEHNGYRHLGITHKRQLTLTPNAELSGEDTITYTNPQHKAVAHFHFHPDMTIHMISEREAQLTTPTSKKLLFTLESGRFIQQHYDYAPHFGQTLPAQKVVVHIPFKKTPTTSQKNKASSFPPALLKWHVKVI